MAEGSALGARRAEALTQVVQIVDIQIGLSLCARSGSLTAIRRNGHDGGLEVRIDVFADGRPQSSQQVADGKSRIGMDATVNAGSTIDIQGYSQGQLAAARRLTP